MKITFWKWWAVLHATPMPVVYRCSRLLFWGKGRSLMSLLLNNPKHEVGSASSSWMTKIPELGPSGGGKESASGDFLYNERGLVTYISQEFKWTLIFALPQFLFGFVACSLWSLLELPLSWPDSRICRPLYHDCFYYYTGESNHS